MAIEKVSFGNCIIFALALAEVTSWTIDLPEVRKYVFERNEREKEKVEELEEFQYKKDESDTPLYYSNIEGNSKHNSKHFDTYENTAYAREYGYESYMEKKVHDIVYNGSVYLEGLRRSLENYTTFLETCNRANYSTARTSQNSTSWRPSIEVSNSNLTNPSSNGPTNPSSNGSTNPSSNGSTNPSSNGPTSSSSFLTNSTFLSRCREATNKSEHVRRLADLAMWAARELQDIAYARKYHKGDDTSLGMEENELILKLAWFLDRLAHFTGYEPEPKDFLQTKQNSTTTTTAAPTPPSIANASSEVTRQMMSCLKSRSPGDAVDRCRYPEPLPPVVQMMMEMNSNITGIPAMPVPPSNMNDQVVPVSRSSRSENPLSDQTMELLVAADNKSPFYNFPPTMTAVKHIQKRSVLSIAKPEVNKYAGNLINVRGSSENDPVINFLKYYAKHKVWEGANIKPMDKKFQEFEVKNHLASHSVYKRGIVENKFRHLRLPENPYQDISTYIKHKPGINYVKDEALAKKIKSTIEKNYEKPTSSNKLISQLTKLLRPTRSITYEKDIDLPRESLDPQKDISYYTKNKEGRNYNNDIRQAVQVRAGLEQVFNTGNIEVVRRFGANYNPANPNPFLFGVLISQADF